MYIHISITSTTGPPVHRGMICHILVPSAPDEHATVPDGPKRAPVGFRVGPGMAEDGPEKAEK
eukprot:5871387-Pyramimonas_sp.AAC.1